jgi:hypothetical protein
MLQVLYIDVAKVDRDVAHVLMAIHVFFRCIFQVFHLFQIYVAKVDLDVSYTCMLQAYVFKYFQMFHTYVCKCFIWMLNVFAMVFNYFRRFSSV